MEEKKFDPIGLLAVLEESVRVGDPQKALLASLFGAYQREQATFKINEQKLKMILKVGRGNSGDFEEEKAIRSAMAVSRKMMDDIKSWMKLELRDLQSADPGSEIVRILVSAIKFFDNHG